MPDSDITKAVQVPVLQNTASSANITPLYVRAKQLICCTLVTILQQVWLALTICGTAQPHCCTASTR